MRRHHVEDHRGLEQVRKLERRAHRSTRKAATPGSVRPSIHSRNAPPAVETYVNSLRHAGMVERGDGIPAAGHRDQAALLGQRRRRLRQRHRRGVERRRLEGAERAVPHQRAAGLEDVGERLDRVAGRRRGSSRRPRPRGRCRCAGSADWRRIPSPPRRHRADGRCSRRPRRRRRSPSASPVKFVLAQRLADIDAARGEEGVGHAAADDQVLDLADEVLEHGQLGRNLGPADHRRDRAARDCPAPFRALPARPASPGRHKPGSKCASPSV